MANKIFYYEWFTTPGRPAKVLYSKYYYFRLFVECDRMWRQGPKGGVKVLKEDFMDDAYINKTRPYYGHTYVTRNEQAMKEFMWVKLSAREYKEK